MDIAATKETCSTQSDEASASTETGSEHLSDKRLELNTQSNLWWLFEQASHRSWRKEEPGTFTGRLGKELRGATLREALAFKCTPPKCKALLGAWVCSTSSWIEVTPISSMENWFQQRQDTPWTPLRAGRGEWWHPREILWGWWWAGRQGHQILEGTKDMKFSPSSRPRCKHERVKACYGKENMRKGSHTDW